MITKKKYFTVVLVIPENVDEPVVRVVRDISGSSADAAASTQTFTQGGGHGGLGGGLSGSAASAGASTQTFTQGGGHGGLGGGLSGSAANAGASTQTFSVFL